MICEPNLHLYMEQLNEIDTYVPIDAPKRANKNRIDLIKSGELGRENHKRFGR